MRKTIVICSLIALLPAVVQAAGPIIGWGDWVYVAESEMTDLMAVDAGYSHCLGLRPDGTIVAWGENRSGACVVPEPNSDFVAVSAGGGIREERAFSIGLKSDGSIVAWGWKSDGQCEVPDPNTDFVAISAGGVHSLGLKSDGSIVAWGANDYGQCNVPEPNTGFEKVAASRRYSLGLKNDGTIVAWGYNYGELPEPNSGFIDVVAAKYWGLGSFSYGIPHNLGLKSDGSIVAWGANYANHYGQCDVPEPNSDFEAIAATVGHSMGLKSDGSIVAWGANHCGQCEVPEPNTGYTAIAAGGASYRFSPEFPGCWSENYKGCSFGLKADGGLHRWGFTSTVPYPNRDFTQVARGEANGLGLKSDGSVVTWQHEIMAGYAEIPEPNSNFIAVATRSFVDVGPLHFNIYAHCLGLKSDGVIVAWGYGDTSVPEPNTGFVAVSVGNRSMYGLKLDGSVVAWGNNYSGQCDVPEPNSDFVAIDAGKALITPPFVYRGYALGVKSDGSIVGWGNNSFGQCDVPDPNTDFIAVNAGPTHVLGLKSDGSIVGWGDNESGQCDVPEPNVDFIAIAADYGRSTALKPDGTVVVWGSSEDHPVPNTGFESICAHSTGIRTESPVSVVEQDEYPSDTIPKVTQLIGAYPNPFNPQTIIAFTLQRDQRVTIDVFSPTGVLVCTLASGVHSAGEHQITWNGRDTSNRTIASGTYIIRLATEERVEARKVMLVR